MTTRQIEITVGVFVAAGLLALLMLAMQVSNLGSFSGDKGYRVSALFDNVGGLKAKSAVTMSGVLVGRVASVGYDSTNFKAKVIIDIFPEFDYLPIDSQASIYTAGLLGEQYIALEPGAEMDVLENGSVIEYTQSAMVLEEIIGQVMVKLTSE